MSATQCLVNIQDEKNHYIWVPQLLLFSSLEHSLITLLSPPGRQSEAMQLNGDEGSEGEGSPPPRPAP